MSEPRSDSMPVQNVDRVLLVGDTHGNTGWIQQVVIPVAKALDCQVILQLGDFGFWAHRERGRQFLAGVQDALDTAGLDLWWVDGNHENHALLGVQDHGDDHFWRIGRIVHAGRGAVWEWGGRRFMACGGAYSIDKEYREEGESWWPGEVIDQEDVDRCTDEGVCDVLVTHDAPVQATDAIPHNGTWDRQKDNWPESKANREMVQQIVDRCYPKLVVHGHYHHRYSQDAAGVQVEGFGCDNDWIGSMGVLRLPSLTVESVDAMPTVAAEIGRSAAEHTQGGSDG